MRVAVLLAVALLAAAGCGAGAGPSGGSEGELVDVQYGWSDAEYPPPREDAPWAHEPVGAENGGNVTPEEQAQAEEMAERPDAPPHFNDGD